jgi:hypothetical protein
MVSLIFRLAGTLPSSEESTTLAIVRATITAGYRFKPSSEEVSEEELRNFALCYAPFHVWGYWREFVQNSLARLHLPTVTIPLFLIQQAPNMVQEKID